MQLSVRRFWEGWDFDWKKLFSHYPHDTWYSIDVEQIDRNPQLLEDVYERGIEFLEQEGYKWWYHLSDLEHVVQQHLEEQKLRVLGFIRELKAVMQALADEPIYASSGIKRPRKRKQINWHTHPAQTITHPRVAIMHPQRPYQDVLNEVASQLANLPNYIARVRITTDEEELVEHTIKTLKPEQGLDENGLAKRIARIKQNMRALGYYRAKTDVDEEIRKRHEQLRQAQGLPVPKPKQPPPQPQPHYARQVPVQGHCPKCNATNPRTATFCNHCGAKLTQN